MSVYSWGGALVPPWPEDEVTQPYPVAKPEPKRCFLCKRELCHELDAWHGKDNYWGDFCSPCRRKHGVK